MSDSAKADKIQIIALGVVCFGLVAFSIPLICSQLIPAAEVNLFDAPGQSAINIPKKGAYIIYHEKLLDDTKAVQEAGQAAAEKLKILISSPDRPRDGALELTPIQNEYVYRSDRRKGVSLYRFETEVPGRYVLRCYYRNKSATPKLRMALGEGTINSASMRRTILILIAAVNGVLVIAVLLLVRKLLGG